jgi:ABC-2 type transport system ATP-binding protein
VARVGDDLLERFSLTEAANRVVKTYSGGMRRRLDLAVSLVATPPVLFLDEPTTGLDPRSRVELWDVLRELVREGTTLLLTTQYLEEADALSDRIILIDRGTIIAEGTANELKHRAGGTFCEIVPRDVKELPAMVAALGPLLPEHQRGMLTAESDRIIMPAADGTSTLIEAVRLLNAAHLEPADIALRRPSLDDVFLSMTADPSESRALSHLTPEAVR